VLALILIAVYAMTLANGRWPMSHPYSGLSMLLAVLVFGALDRAFARGRIASRQVAALRITLPIGAALLLTAAVLMFVANRESL
jgi:hypothetical protein